MHNSKPTTSQLTPQLTPPRSKAWNDVYGCNQRPRRITTSIKRQAELRTTQGKSRGLRPRPQQRKTVSKSCILGWWKTGSRHNAHPLTNLVVFMPQIVPCSPIAKPMSKVNGDWLCQTPELEPCAAPAQLSADLKMDFNLDDNEGRGVPGSLCSSYQRQAYYSLCHSSIWDRNCHNNVDRV